MSLSEPVNTAATGPNCAKP